MNLRDQLIKHEGLKLTPYRDSVGKLTIGVGHNLDDVGINESVAMSLLDWDIGRAVIDLERAFPWVTKLDSVRHDALINMCFNMGIGRLRGFVQMLSALEQGNWQEAAKQALASRWAVQVGSRSQELAQQIITGAYA